MPIEYYHIITTVIAQYTDLHRHIDLKYIEITTKYSTSTLQVLLTFIISICVHLMNAGKKKKTNHKRASRNGMRYKYI